MADFAIIGGHVLSMDGPGDGGGRDFSPGAVLIDDGAISAVGPATIADAVEDHAEPERRRHLLRLWLAMPNSRRLPAPFKALYGTVEAGAIRGGVPPGAGV